MAFCPAAEPYYLNLNSVRSAYGIETPVRYAMFLAQVAHESGGFKRLEENLNYSAEALLEKWPKRFTATEAQSYARQPERIANRIYAGRIGNRDEASGDGWRFRGRGLIHITGLKNYARCGAAISPVPDFFIKNPEALKRPIYAAESAGWFWRDANCSAAADQGDFELVTRRINGGLNGLEDRLQWWAKAKQILGVTA